MSGFKTRVIQVPYDSGHRDYRMGRGPGRIARLAAENAEEPLALDAVAVEDRVGMEIATSFQVARELALKVRKTRSQGELPLVLAGGCISCIGTLAGLGAPSPALIWLDAHGDFNTPESTLSGFLDGMGLAAAVGRCWSHLAASVPGFVPVPEAQALLVGAREFDAEERALLDASAVQLVPPQTLRQQGMRNALVPLLAELGSYSRRAYLHIDLDVLDPAAARVNQFAAPGGLILTELLEIVRLVRAKLILAAVALTAYDPEYDEGDKALSAALAVIRELSRQD